MSLDTIFINVPVKNLDRSIEFYTKLGFRLHPVFRSEEAACMCITDHIHLMLQTESHLKRFTSKPIADPAKSTGVMLCLHCDSPAHVDEIVRKALVAGGTTHDQARDMGFLYTHGFTDPEGYTWKLNHIYPTAKDTHPADADREIVSIRIIDASREAVFQAFCEPTRLAQWWGPKGFTNTFHEFDFRPGGRWRFEMRGHDGTAYTMDKLFTDIVRPERIVVRHFQPAHDFLLTMTLANRDGRTELTWRMRFEDPAECARAREFIVAANEENFDRLEAHLRQGS